MLLLVLHCDARSTKGKAGRAPDVDEIAREQRVVFAEVDGVSITDGEAFEEALGIYGVDLVSGLDSDLATKLRRPGSIKFRARDIKKSKKLQNGALGYLLQYGYLEVAAQRSETDLLESDMILGERELMKAMRKLQKKNGLAVTGLPDAATVAFLGKTRCGVKDMEYEPPSRAKRYTHSRNQWADRANFKNKLKYWIDPDKYTQDLEPVVIRKEMKAAFKLWADVSNVTFIEVAAADDADIKISWEYGDHGDKYAFYGKNGALAHAFYPFKGLLHFDDAEDFTAGTISGTNLKYVATHEMGHILGIKHADWSLNKAVMYPLYPGYSDKIVLHADDISAVVDLMGDGSGSVITLNDDSGAAPNPNPPNPNPPTVEPNNIPPSCIEKIDGAFHWDGGYGNNFVYIFAGKWYYRLKPKNPNNNNLLPVLDESYAPRRIGYDGFIGLPRGLDASVERLANVNHFFSFRDDDYFIYDIQIKGVIESGKLSDLWTVDTPTKIDSAFKIRPTQLGFISGDDLYTYTTGTGSTGVGMFEKASINHMSGVSAKATSMSWGFYSRWTWAFDGRYYSVAKSTNGQLNVTYKDRLIFNDIKLNMCPEAPGSLNKKGQKRCKKELSKIKRERPGRDRPAPSAECRDYIAEHYTSETRFNPNSFTDF